VESALDTSRAQASSACTGENRERWHHLEIADVYAGTVAKSGGLRRSEDAAIGHRSFRRRTEILAQNRSKARGARKIRKEGESVAGEVL
jgi:hypothetical protein